MRARILNLKGNVHRLPVHRLLWLLLTFSLPMVTLGNTGPTRLPAPHVEVRLKAEIEALASGFEQAFARLPAGPRFIQVHFPGEAQPRFLDGSVRNVEAVEGVVVITMEKGLFFVVSARAITAITNRSPEGGVGTG
ncbi:MAG: hypothetical protein ACFE0O_06705 [Opitutales bacterium]